MFSDTSVVVTIQVKFAKIGYNFRRKKVLHLVKYNEKGDGIPNKRRICVIDDLSTCFFMLSYL